jgi:hypothetical protein
MAEPPVLPSYFTLNEPELAFHPERREDRSAHPLEGLLAFGPYSRSLLNTILDPIRIASIVPSGDGHVLDGLLAESERQHQPRERRQYLPAFPGFSRVFGLRAVLAPAARIELPQNLHRELADSDQPHLVLSERLTQAIGTLAAQRTEFDVLFIYLPTRFAPGFEGSPDEDFDLHDYMKAIAAMRGIPTQIIREDKAIAYPCRASVMWRLGIALYCKAGGVPWKLADSDPDTAYIGLSYALRPTPERGPRFVTCCSQVFDSDGAGLEFIAYETEDVRIERRNPFLSRGEMRRVMARSLALYQQRHAGRIPKRVVVHKSTEFKPDEIEGCFDALAAAETVDLIQVKQHGIWRGIAIDAPRGQGQKGMPSAYPCERGAYLPVGRREVLLWTQGNAPAAVGGKNYYKEGKGIPSPLELVRFAGHGGFEESCRGVLGLSKMNWNNDGLYDRLPVTMAYAQVLAQTVKRMTHLAPRPYQFRFFM